MAETPYYYYNYEVIDEKNGEQICVFSLTDKSPHLDPDRLGRSHYKAPEGQIVKHVGTSLDRTVCLS